MNEYEHLAIPRIPVELESQLTDEAFMRYQSWRDEFRRPGEVWNTMPDPLDTEFGRVVKLPAAPGYDENGNTIVLPLPYAQAWKPSMAIRASLLQTVVDPGAEVVVLPNNTLGQRSYGFTTEERQKLGEGDLRPLFEGSVRRLEAAQVRGEDVYATGFSMGALTALGIAAVGAGNFSLKAVDATEMPNRQRTPKELQADFMASGGWTTQRAAIQDVQLPALERALNVPRLAADYTRFGLDHTLLADNRALYAGMAAFPGRRDAAEAPEIPGDGIANIVRDAVWRQNRIAIGLGFVAGSKLTDGMILHEQITEATQELRSRNVDNPSIRIYGYSGAAAHRHATGDNPLAVALMAKRTFDRAQAA